MWSRSLKYALWLHVLVAVAQNTTSSTSSIAGSQQNTESTDVSVSDATIFLTRTSTEFETVQPSASSPAADSTSYTTVFSFPSASTDRESSVVTDAALASAVACNRKKLDWSRAYGQTAIGGNTIWSTVYTQSLLSTFRAGFTETLLVGNTSQAYTLCDGWPRVALSSTYHESTSVQSSIWTTTDYVTTSASTYVDPPSCTIAPRECDILQSSFSAENSTWASYIADATAIRQDITKPYAPICDVPTLTSSAPGPWATLGPAACVDNGATIQLLYWPVETVGDRLCGNYSTIAPTETLPGTPNTAEDFETTFTSPTVYMVFKGAYSVASNYAVGSEYRAILPLSSTSVSSICGQLDGSFDSPQQADFADFNSPVPASAYRCQPKCFGHPQDGESRTNYRSSGVAENLCSTIYDNYDPALEIPTAAFKSYFTNGLGLQLSGGKGQHCSYDPDIPGGIIFDPPKALRKIGSIAAPTKPGDAGPTTTPATPADSPTTIRGPTKPATAEPTGEPEGDDDNENDSDDDNNDSSPEAEPADGGSDSPTTKPEPAKPATNKPTERPASDHASDKEGDDNTPAAQPASQGGSGNSSDDPSEDQESNGKNSVDNSQDGGSEPTTNIGDIIASGFGMLSPSGSGPTQAPGAAPTGASDVSVGETSGGGQSGDGSSVVNNSDGEASGGEASDNGQTIDESKDAGNANVDVGAIIVSAANMKPQAAAEATALPHGASTGSAAASNTNLDAANANAGNGGDSIESSLPNQASSGSSSSTGAQAQGAAQGDDADDMIQVAVITGQNGRVVTATLVSSSVILPQATLAADQGPTDVLGLGRISVNGDLIAVDEGEPIPFTSIVNVPAEHDDDDNNDVDDYDESSGVAILTIGDETLTLAPAPNANGLILAGSSTKLTLAGTSAVTLDGTILALPSTAATAVGTLSSIVINGQTSAFFASSETSTGSFLSGTRSASASDDATTRPSTIHASGTQASASSSSSETAVGDNGAGATEAPLWTWATLLFAVLGVLIT